MRKYLISFGVILLFMIFAELGCIKYSVDGTVPPRFILSDSGNNRVLLGYALPVNGGYTFGVALGQTDLYSSNTYPVSASSFGAPPNGVCFDGKRLIVSDGTNNRVLIWNTFPNQMNQAADLVLGQPDFTSSISNNTPGSPGTVGSQSLSIPTGVFCDGQHLFVVDRSNNRIMIWNKMPTLNQQAADLVLGQVDFVSHVKATTATNFGSNYMYGITSDGARLVATDYNRILIWNSLPSQNGQAADVVLGQPDFITSALSTGATAISAARTVSLFDGKLLTSDVTYNRILIWNKFPTQNQQPADLVLGQPDFNQTVANNTLGAPGTVSASSLYAPWGLSYDGSSLIVADDGNNRMLGWNSLPTSNAQPADYVIGQPNMASSAAGAGPSVFTTPTNIFSNGIAKGVEKPRGY